MDFGLPDQLDANYGNSSAPAVRMPGTPRPVPNTQQGFGAPPANPYAQYGKPINLKPKAVPQQAYPTQEIEGYEMQMIRGVPNAAPFAIDQISPTPFNRGDYDPVYNVSGKPYNWSKAPTYQGYGNPLADLWSSFWSQGVPAAPINASSSAEQRMALGQALAYIGVLAAPTDDYAILGNTLKELQKTANLPQTGEYDVATQTVVAKGYTAKRQGQTLDEAWKQAQQSGVLPEWWTASPPSSDIVDYTQEESSTSKYLKMAGIGIGVLLVFGGIVYFMRRGE